MPYATRILALLTVSTLMLLLGACASTRPPVGAKRDYLVANAQATVSLFEQRDPQIERFFTRSYGYAVFPTVAKGAIGIGGANGRGLVYEENNLVGYTTLSQATFGLQLGGQTYSEIIFFKDMIDLKHFQEGKFEFNAQASAVAIHSGASADADYSRGVAIFTMTKGGLMYEASVGGQKFTYEPLHEE